MLPLLNRELIDWYDGNKIEDFDNEFELEYIIFPKVSS